MKQNVSTSENISQIVSDWLLKWSSEPGFESNKDKLYYYPLLTLQKSKATVRYETDFSLKYFAYLRTKGDMSYPRKRMNNLIFSCQSEKSVLTISRNISEWCTDNLQTSYLNQPWTFISAWTKMKVLSIQKKQNQKVTKSYMDKEQNISKHEKQSFKTHCYKASKVTYVTKIRFWMHATN